MKRALIKSLALALLATVATARVALAYLDPNTGGMLFQVLATSLAAVTGVALLFSRQIRVAIGRVRRSLRRAGYAENRETSHGALDVERTEDEEQR